MACGLSSGIEEGGRDSNSMQQRMQSIEEEGTEENEMCSIDPQLTNVKHILGVSNSSATNVDCCSKVASSSLAIDTTCSGVFYLVSLSCPWGTCAGDCVCVRARIWHNGAVNGDTKPAVVCLPKSPYITPK